MKIKNSELRIEKFNLLGINIISFPSEPDEKIEISDTCSDFDLDFDFFVNREDGNQFKIMVRLNNHAHGSTPKGYGIEVSGEFVFKFDKEIKIKEEKKHTLMSRSAFPMAIAHIRSIIATTTSNFFMGSYYLPSIDLVDLYKKKQENINDITVELT